jgi:hypothetical protein
MLWRCHKCQTHAAAIHKWQTKIMMMYYMNTCFDLHNGCVWERGCWVTLDESKNTQLQFWEQSLILLDSSNSQNSLSESKITKALDSRKQESISNRKLRNNLIWVFLGFVKTPWLLLVLVSSVIWLNVWVKKPPVQSLSVLKSSLSF